MTQNALPWINERRSVKAKLDQHLPDVKATSRAQADLIADVVRGR